jgi:hypothetical protein
MDEKIKIILDGINEKIDSGIWDSDLNLPFTSRKMLKIVVEKRMNTKIQTKSNPIFSDNEIKDCVNEVRETAVVIASLFLKNGILEKTDNGLDIGHVMKRFFNH